MLKIETLDRISPAFSFVVASGHMMITDPCYDPGTWCAEDITGVPNGEWRTKLGYTLDADDLAHFDHWIADCEGRLAKEAEDSSMRYVLEAEMGRLKREKEAYRGRVAVQMTWLASSMSDERAEQLMKENLPGFKQAADVHIGVDSGQAGFFDYVQYVEQGSYERSSLIYRAICDLTCDKGDMGGAVLAANGQSTFGSVSSSGYGDGGYPLFVLYEQERPVAMAIVFMSEYEEEGEEATEEDSQQEGPGL